MSSRGVDFQPITTKSNSLEDDNPLSSSIEPRSPSSPPPSPPASLTASRPLTADDIEISNFEPTDYSNIDDKAKLLAILYTKQLEVVPTEVRPDNPRNVKWDNKTIRGIIAETELHAPQTRNVDVSEIIASPNGTDYNKLFNMAESSARDRMADPKPIQDLYTVFVNRDQLMAISKAKREAIKDKYGYAHRETIYSLENLRNLIRAMDRDPKALALKPDQILGPKTSRGFLDLFRRAPVLTSPKVADNYTAITNREDLREIFLQKKRIHDVLFPTTNRKIAEPNYADPEQVRNAIRQLDALDERIKHLDTGKFPPQPVDKYNQYTDTDQLAHIFKRKWTKAGDLRLVADNLRIESIQNPDYIRYRIRGLDALSPEIAAMDIDEIMRSYTPPASSTASPSPRAEPDDRYTTITDLNYLRKMAGVKERLWFILNGSYSRTNSYSLEYDDARTVRNLIRALDVNWIVKELSIDPTFINDFKYDETRMNEYLQCIYDSMKEKIRDAKGIDDQAILEGSGLAIEAGKLELKPRINERGVQVGTKAETLRELIKALGAFYWSNMSGFDVASCLV